jgi:hypothetical protein
METAAQESPMDELWQAIQDHETARVAFVLDSEKNFERFLTATKRLSEAYALVGAFIAQQNRDIQNLRQQLWASEEKGIMASGVIDDILTKVRNAQIAMEQQR